MSSHQWLGKLHTACKCTSGHKWINASHSCGCAAGDRLGVGSSCGRQVSPTTVGVAPRSVTNSATRRTIPPEPVSRQTNDPVWLRRYAVQPNCHFSHKPPSTPGSSSTTASAAVGSTPSPAAGMVEQCPPVCRDLYKACETCLYGNHHAYYLQHHRCDYWEQGVEKCRQQYCNLYEWCRATFEDCPPVYYDTCKSKEQDCGCGPMDIDIQVKAPYKFGNPKVRQSQHAGGVFTAITARARFRGHSGRDCELRQFVRGFFVRKKADAPEPKRIHDMKDQHVLAIRSDIKRAMEDPQGRRRTLDCQEWCRLESKASRAHGVNGGFEAMELPEDVFVEDVSLGNFKRYGDRSRMPPGQKDNWMEQHPDGSWEFHEEDEPKARGDIGERVGFCLEFRWCVVNRRTCCVAQRVGPRRVCAGPWTVEDTGGKSIFLPRSPMYDSRLR
jgi:hypothetical protein